MASRDKNKVEVPIPEVIHDRQNGRVYQRGNFFGKGGFAKCYEIIDTSTKGIFAGKIVPKTLLQKTGQKDKMAQEIEIHRSLDHKHVVKFFNCFDDPDFFYVVLELCRKRSLMELHKRRKAVTEPEVRYIMKQILDGVLYLHDNNIVHRDLKLSNIFLDDNLVLKIGDFGLAARIEFKGQRKKTMCGTPNYIAPEVITKQGHSFEVDVWSIGCIMYTLLVGKPPFETDSLRETYSKIKRCEYHLPTSMNRSAAMMVSSMLQPEPSKRPSVRKLLDMEFMVSGYCPRELPISVLTTAPRFTNVKDSLGRKPLLDVNPIIKEENLGPRKSMFASSSEVGKTNSLTPVGALCHGYLRQLNDVLTQLLAKHPPRLAEEFAEEKTDPSAQPFVWIGKWVDYSDKYGFGYQLCDDSVGVMFNDHTRIVLLADQRNVHYIEKDGKEHYFTVGKTAERLDKKMKLLAYFRRYMIEHLMKAGASIPLHEADSYSRIPYLNAWQRSSHAVLMQLTNGSVQINFMDHTKIVLCPLMKAVTYIDLSNNFFTYRFETIMKEGCVPGLLVNLEYACRKISQMLKI